MTTIDQTPPQTEPLATRLLANLWVTVLKMLMGLGRRRVVDSDKERLKAMHRKAARRAVDKLLR